MPVPSSTRLVGQRLDHRAAGRIGIKLHQQRILRVPAGDMQRVDDIAALVQRLENMPHAERDGDGGAPIEPAQAVEGGVERQAADHAQRMRIGERRAVAVEIRQHVQARRRDRRPSAARSSMTRSAIRGVHGGIRLAAGAVPANDVVEQRAGCRLAAFGEPEVRAAPRRNMAPRRRRRAAARRDIAMTQLDVPAISARCRSMPRRSPAKPPSTPSAPA